MLLAPGADAARCQEYSIEVLVRGVPATEYRLGSTTYIEAHQDEEYAVRLTNNSAQSIAVALSVDGLNTIDARTTSAATASKWVLPPWQSVTIEGWQIDLATARRFFFTTEQESYGAWLGRTANLGVIEAAVFRQRQPRPVQRQEHPASSSKQRSQAAPSESAAKPGEWETEDSDLAATGIGRATDNPVRRVRFVSEPEPAARLRIRYEYRPQLVQLGVLPSPEVTRGLGRREHAQGFTDPEFCPDPFRHEQR